MFRSLWLASFVIFLPSYGFGLALVTGLALYTRFRNSELRLAALEREWSAARLAALRMQLSPHTLFNLLHTIRGHIEWDPEGAQSMVVQLADLLRRLLNAGERDFSRLADELQFARLYLELQQRRFADRLSVELPEPAEVPAVWVPSLILQPLVENAVVHGLADHQGPVFVRITVRIEHDRLILRVHNTIAPGKLTGEEGIGLRTSASGWPSSSRARSGLAGCRGRHRVDQRDHRCPPFASHRRPRETAARYGGIGRHMMDVIIVDDEPAGRRTLHEFCEAESDLRVVGEYGDGASALAAIRTAAAAICCFSTSRWAP